MQYAYSNALGIACNLLRTHLKCLDLMREKALTIAAHAGHKKRRGFPRPSACITSPTSPAEVGYMTGY